MKQVAKQIRVYLKSVKLNHVTVKVIDNEIIVVDNLVFLTATELASHVSGLEFEHITQSITRLKK